VARLWLGDYGHPGLEHIAHNQRKISSMTFLWLYLTLTLVIALWLGTTMWRQLDEFDWRYRSTDVWIGFWMGLLLWPLWLVLKPAFILKGTVILAGDTPETINIGGNLAKRHRQLHQIIDNPPRCGEWVSYSYSCLGRDTVPTEVIFKASDIEKHFKDKALPLFWGDEQEALVKFIKSRDNSPETTAIPDIIDFEEMASELIDAGIGKVYCNSCKEFYDAHVLRRGLPPMHPGWNFAEYFCPADHQVLSRKHMHIHCRFDHE